MGIRESLKEQPDELKMQDFVIEDEPKQKKDFDLNKLISPEDWKELIEHAKFLSDSTKISLAIFIKIISPEKLPESKINLSRTKEHLQQKINEYIESQESPKFKIDHSALKDFIFNLYALKSLFGNEVDIDQYMDHDTWENVIRYLKQRKKHKNLGLEIYEDFFRLAIVFPEELRNQKILSKAEWESFSKGNFLSMEFTPRYKELIIGNVLFPDKVNIEQSKNSKNEKKFKEYLHDTVEYLKDPDKDETDYVIKEAMSNLAFFKLANCGFEITKEGLQPKPQQESFQQKTPPRPERRNF